MLSYRQILKERLEERCRTNPRYSLRAFARDLGLSPSRLSQILQGKQGLSEGLATALARRLGLDTREAAYFATLVASTDARSKQKREAARLALSASDEFSPVLEPSRILQLDAFNVVSDWYHFAIVEMTRLKTFKNNPTWIAKKLGITVHEVSAAIDRLKRLEIFEERDGRLYCSDTQLATTDGVPSEAIRKFHRQILSKAIDAITFQAVEERDFTTVTVAIDPREVGEFKAHLKAFRRRVNSMASRKLRGSSYRATEVYCLALNFFRLTQRDVS